MSFLLDANALIALCWPQHIHHKSIQKWFGRHAAQGWSTCALTQAAFVRISLQPAFALRSTGLDEVAELLAEVTSHATHSVVSLVDTFDAVVNACSGGIVGHRQITDAWLLTTAIANRVKLVTFDHGISSLLATERERTEHLIAL